MPTQGRSTPGGDGIDRSCVGQLTQPKLMTTSILLSKTFEIELEDNTTINVKVFLQASTEDDDEDFQASQRIKSFNYDNVIEPLEETLTELFTAEDLADSIGTGGDMLTADDYPESAE